MALSVISGVRLLAIFDSQNIFCEYPDWTVVSRTSFAVLIPLTTYQRPKVFSHQNLIATEFLAVKLDVLSIAIKLLATKDLDSGTPELLLLLYRYRTLNSRAITWRRGTSGNWIFSPHFGISAAPCEGQEKEQEDIDERGYWKYWKYGKRKSGVEMIKTEVFNSIRSTRKIWGQAQ